MRKKIIAGNWKMNKTFEEAEDLVVEIVEFLEETEFNKTEVVICPPAPYLELASDIALETKLSVGAQNIYAADAGAYTGEISAMMLGSMGIHYCIIGHSERRKYFNESHEMLAEKLDLCLTHNIIPIFCIGEVIEDREAGAHFDVVAKQLKDSAFHFSADRFRQIVLAYEPVWAIGTGVNATPAQAQEMHAYIRQLVSEKYGEKVAGDITILYGGSCNANNAAELFANPDVDGGLIGGASLKAEEFTSIIIQNNF